MWTGGAPGPRGKELFKISKFFPHFRIVYTLWLTFHYFFPVSKVEGGGEFNPLNPPPCPPRKWTTFKHYRAPLVYFPVTTWNFFIYDGPMSPLSDGVKFQISNIGHEHRNLAFKEANWAYFGQNRIFQRTSTKKFMISLHYLSNLPQNIVIGVFGGADSKYRH